jgi:carotenoid cleavage dioxygenase-like enzyme
MGPLDLPANVSGRLPPPFVWSPGEGTRQVELEGRLPEWLNGSLVRTCPAVFELPAWRAQHWFDGLCLLYSFELARGRVAFRERLLDSQAAEAALAGRLDLSAFRTPMQRPFWKRVFQPKPKTTDNANVNVIPFRGDLLVMTETVHQHLADVTSLESKGVRKLDDTLADLSSTTAHPQHDPARGAMVNVGSLFARRSEVVVFREDLRTGSCVIEGRLPRKRMPYLHSFGLSDNAVVVIEHPLTVNPASMLWSERGFIDHFKWRPEDGTRFWKLDRRSGTFSEYESEACFVFHVVNQFEEGNDLVLDYVAHPDVAWIHQLSTDELARRLPGFDTPLMRVRLEPGKKVAKPERIGDACFEFPSINYRAQSGRPHRYVWGVDLRSDRQKFTSTTVKVDASSGDVTHFAEPGWALGEPVFVSSPEPSAEDDGVLLSVGSHRDGKRAALFVHSAHSLELLARAEVEADIPLGFHGSFVRNAD